MIFRSSRQRARCPYANRQSEELQLSLIPIKKWVVVENYFEMVTHTKVLTQNRHWSVEDWTWCLLSTSEHWFSEVGWCCQRQLAAGSKSASTFQFWTFATRSSQPHEQDMFWIGHIFYACWSNINFNPRFRARFPISKFRIDPPLWTNVDSVTIDLISLTGRTGHLVPPASWGMKPSAQA